MSTTLSSVDVSAIAEGLAAVSVPWDLGVVAPPASRRYERILATEAYDAWLIYWPPGTGVEVHDHGESVGAFTVVSGALDEEVVINGTPVGNTIHAGESLFLPSRHVHAVRNRGETSATSVHVYSPPLRSMGFYRADDEGRLVLERIEEANE